MGDEQSIFLTKLLSHGNSAWSSFMGRMFYLGGNNHVLLPKHEIQLCCELKAVLKGLSFLSFILISCKSRFSSLLSFTFERAKSLLFPFPTSPCARFPFSVTQLTVNLCFSFSFNTFDISPQKSWPVSLTLMFFINYEMQNHGNSNKKGASACFLFFSSHTLCLTMGLLLVKYPSTGKLFS